MAASADEVRVTQRVSLSDVADLVERPPRAAIAFTGSDGPECAPVVVCQDRAGMLIGAAADIFSARIPERVVLLTDDGSYWFELRAVVWRGAITAVDDRDTQPDPDLRWFRIEPRSCIAWDYEQLHEERLP